MKHIFKEGKSLKGPTFLLLHGTGGSENDLLPLAEIMDPDANILSVRGSVSENGMARFFKRLAEGGF
ncbi:carboxylesterase [Gracilibacillus boraciitolerans JCM 21714]|uniref:Carboxylesterase n=1 Tax=Gracilibacillus boraciitolerans JCM 21714 TaxID=1298598 RepID=W4VNZ1_9BACI|nr:carboxylesterase [Gracilibacillus boraciitolerans JCM 21714]